MVIKKNYESSSTSRRKILQSISATGVTFFGVNHFTTDARAQEKPERKFQELEYLAEKYNSIESAKKAIVDTGSDLLKILSEDGYISSPDLEMLNLDEIDDLQTHLKKLKNGESSDLVIHGDIHNDGPTARIQVSLQTDKNLSIIMMVLPEVNRSYAILDSDNGYEIVDPDNPNQYLDPCYVGEVCVGPSDSCYTGGESRDHHCCNGYCYWGQWKGDCCANAEPLFPCCDLCPLCE